MVSLNPCMVMLRSLSIGGESDKIYGHELYAPTIFEPPKQLAEDIEGKPEHLASKFYSEDTKWPLTGTPLYHVHWLDDVDPPVPKFGFEKGSEILADKFH